MGFADNFSNIANASSGGATYFKGNGRYRLAIKSFQVKDVPVKNSNKKKEAVIAEVEVVTSTNPDHPVGSVRTFFRYTEDEKTIGEVKNLFFAACLGKEPSAVKSPTEDPTIHNQCAALIQAASDAKYAAQHNLPTNFYVGRALEVECEEIDTKAGNKFTKLHWHPVTA